MSPAYVQGLKLSAPLVLPLPPPKQKKHLFGAIHLFGGKLKNIAFLKLKMSSSLVALVLLHS